ncbi:MAG TPA: hypothetical protein VIL55_11295 [Naasia sp.]|jgi:hypothetical protein
MAEVKLRYRGFRIRPFLRFRPIHIGSTRLYTLGPVAVFIDPPTAPPVPPRRVPSARVWKD